MALLEDILGQLTGMGFGMGGEGGLSYMGLSDITPADIASRMQSYYGLSGQDLPAQMFQGISKDVLSAGLGKTYSPQVEAHGSSLLSKLRETTGGQTGKRAFGGFSGSGQQQKFSAGVKDVYGKGMSDVLAQTQQQQAQGLESVQDIINQWKETAAGIKGW